MSRKELKEYYLSEYGSLDFQTQFFQRLERVEQKGTSSLIHDSLLELIEDNCAGENESCLTVDEIYQKFCL